MYTRTRLRLAYSQTLTAHARRQERLAPAVAQQTAVSTSFQRTRHKQLKLAPVRRDKTWAVLKLRWSVRRGCLELQAYRRPVERTPKDLQRYIRTKVSIASRSNRLDLSDCRLTEVPAEIFALASLKELSLAGNELELIPEEIGQLHSLEKLMIAGNKLKALPEALTSLVHLEGLWAHGNLLDSLPAGLCHLSNLRVLALGGNRLQELPEELCQLKRLHTLTAPGNALASLPDNLGALEGLHILGLNGNAITSLPESFYGLVAVEEVALQGNLLSALPPLPASPPPLPALKVLSLADNNLRELPPAMLQLPNLQQLYLYGNQLQRWRGPVSTSPSLKQLWLEGNPLTFDTSQTIPPDNVSTLTIGLDAGQVSESAEDAPPSVRISVCTIAPEPSSAADEPPSHAPESAAGTGAAAPLPRTAQAAIAPVAGLQRLLSACKALWEGLGALLVFLRAGLLTMLGIQPPLQAGRDAAQEPGSASQAGYFKLQPWASTGDARAPLLVVSYGSAPGLPNWGGVLNRIAKAVRSEDGGKVQFDTLFVVDPCRNWYGDRDSSGLHAGTAASSEDVREGLLGSYYDRRVAEVCKGYKRVLMIGDSMGATGSLLCCRHATAVLAFCPQVDLSKSSIRPAQSDEWFAELQEQTLAAVRESSASITIHTGNWDHDVYQAMALPQDQVRLESHRVDSHRLALALDKQGKLVPIVRSAIAKECTRAKDPDRHADPVEVTSDIATSIKHYSRFVV